MKYSYIRPRKKSALTQEVLLSLTFFGITLLMLCFTYLFLVYKDYAFVQDTQALQQERAILEKNLEKMKSDIAFIEKQREFAQKIYTQNSVLKDSITNLFDLVPQRITLSEAKLLKNGLVLYGVTPSKDVYNFMLHAPLRSIFHRTYSSFYPAQNGWLHFVSTNYSDKEELTDEN
ncbi:MAG: hypothetical protein JXQ67_04100 [Campylobacterales bacterium]|nr:hypothetical protein [Campylobacterales bacterium]